MGRQRSEPGLTKSAGKKPPPSQKRGRLGGKKARQASVTPVVHKITITKDSEGYVRSSDLPHWVSMSDGIKGRYPTGTNRSDGMAESLLRLSRHYRPSRGPWQVTQPDLDRWIEVVGQNRVVPFLATGVPVTDIAAIKSAIGDRKFAAMPPLESASLTEAFQRQHSRTVSQQLVSAFSAGSATKMFSTAPPSTGLRIDMFLNLVATMQRDSRMDPIAAADALHNHPVPRIAKLAAESTVLSQIDGSSIDPEVMGQNLALMAKGKWADEHLKIWLSLPFYEQVLVDQAGPLLGSSKTRGNVLKHLKIGIDAGVPVDWVVMMLKS